VAVGRRSGAGTRQRLLDAAVRVASVHGAAFSLDAVVRESGVSKGGLLYRFPSRDALVAGLVTDVLERYDEAVARHLDAADDRPGRLHRAHVAATFDREADLDGTFWSDPKVLAALVGVPAVRELSQAADRRWQRELSADGLHPERSAVITRALDGVAVAPLFRDPDEGGCRGPRARSTPSCWPAGRGRDARRADHRPAVLRGDRAHHRRRAGRGGQRRGDGALQRGVRAALTAWGTAGLLP